MIQIIWQLSIEAQTSTHAEMKPFIWRSLNGLGQMEGVSNVEVDHDTKRVKFTGEASSRAQVAEKLRSMGYPEQGTLEGLSAGVANAKSFVSCAIGRMS